MTATFDAVQARRSHSRVTTDAPTRAELLPFVCAAARVADHGALRPWRLIELRGSSRERLGAAFVEASGLTGADAVKLAGKPLRAPLLLAIVARRVPSDKVATWEQDATAAGVAHLLSLLLTDAGWGVMWRTGSHTRSRPVRELHDLAETEDLLGWLYVGGVPEGCRPGVRLPIEPNDHLSALP
ncbi:nitroreductase family protein [Cryobacterium frigoriphilum]|uniref:nitroreductase family protein n=1 Tax=Cryobacterium frigoriphilum TaxID=1259150 RepID=UPI001F543A7B|nr:nitroreductase family protein [Cryobacterium frigoriphilum]